MGVISMIPYKTFAVVGGDLRQAHIANRLASMGKTVYAMLLEQNKALDSKLWAGLEQLPNCEAVILPMPLSSDEETIHTPFSKEKIQAESLFSKIRPDAKIFAGRVTSKMAHLAENHGLKIHDYFPNICDPQWEPSLRGCISELAFATSCLDSRILPSPAPILTSKPVTP